MSILLSNYYLCMGLILKSLTKEMIMIVGEGLLMFLFKITSCLFPC